MHEIIHERLLEIEREEGVVIFYACESGSRAWGFPSADSDYDVRFLYAHPTAWYLSILEGRDVIERPIDAQLDINGWDLRKALRLFRKSNPPLAEWLGSPIVYLERHDIAEQLRELAQRYYSPIACIHHYLHMAEGNYRDYLRRDVIWVKKYFYVLRPLLAIKWIEAGHGVAPTSFGVLVERMLPPGELRTAIEGLIEQKRQGDELAEGPRIPVISEFIERELTRLQAGIEAAPSAPPVEELDQLFRAALETLTPARSTTRVERE